MKKIVPFLLFPLILVGVLFFSFKQYKNKENIQGSNNIVQNEESINTHILVSPLPSPSATTFFQKTDEINLIISSPGSGTTVNTNEVTVSGSTEPGASVAINDSEVTANSDGSFKTTVPVDEGENYISIVAYNSLGNVAERELLVTRTVSGL